MDEPVTKGYYNPHASTGHACALKGCPRRGINRVWADNHTVAYLCDDHADEILETPQEFAAIQGARIMHVSVQEEGMTPECVLEIER